MLAVLSSAIWAVGFVGATASCHTHRDMTGSIHAERQGPIGVLRIDNPRRRNAMDLAMYAAVPDAVASLLDDTLRVVVLRGEGDLAFGAGSDISEFRAERTGDAARHYNATEAAAADAIEHIPVPVIAAIHGACMGGGVGLALCADLRIAADDARFAITPAKLGVGYPPDAVQRLVAVVGDARRGAALHRPRSAPSKPRRSGS
jgi:enoyl-CoA hydratase/carnithine racemase